MCELSSFHLIDLLLFSIRNKISFDWKIFLFLFRLTQHIDIILKKRWLFFIRFYFCNCSNFCFCFDRNIINIDIICVVYIFFGWNYLKKEMISFFDLSVFWVISSVAMSEIFLLTFYCYSIFVWIKTDFRGAIYSFELSNYPN